MHHRTVNLIGLLLVSLLLGSCSEVRGTSDLGLIVERADGCVVVIETTQRTRLGKVQGLGDLSHASVVYSRDGRFAYVFGRDGGLNKVDLLKFRLVKRVVQAGNSIGGAISQDGRLIAVSNYTPGGIKVFDADTLELVADIPANYGDREAGSGAQRSKVVGLVDAPGQLFVFSLYDADEIWIIDMKDPLRPSVRKFQNVGKQPYDALITPDGRYYIAGLFGEDGLALLDLWDLDSGVRRILDGYGRGERQLPVYKMPHLEGWAAAGGYVFLPAVGQHTVLVVDATSWQEVTRIPVHGQPVFAVARPDGRQVWVNFALPDNDTLQVIDVAALEIINELHPGKAALHMEFTPRGEQVWVSVRDADQVVIYDTNDFRKVSTLAINRPSGIFFSARAHKIGL
ncbi:MAG: cytochrome D1 domain-containing protein [Gammaproteobacteria bacterium]